MAGWCRGSRQLSLGAAVEDEERGGMEFDYRATESGVLKRKSLGGSAWESNPPGMGLPPHNGFEDRGRHRAPSTPVLSVYVADDTATRCRTAVLTQRQPTRTIGWTTVPLGYQ